MKKIFLLTLIFGLLLGIFGTYSYYRINERDKKLIAGLEEEIRMHGKNTVFSNLLEYNVVAAAKNLEWLPVSSCRVGWHLVPI